MADAKRDENHVTTILAALESDGVTPINVGANASIHALKIDDDTTGSSVGGTNAVRDENFVPVFLAVSEDDGVTPVQLFATADGELLIDSN